MKNKLPLSDFQLRVLQAAIVTWLDKIAAVAEGESRVTPLEVQSILPIRSLGRRLEAMLLRRIGEIGTPSESNLSLTLMELLGLYYCLPWGKMEMQMQPVFGDVQRLLLNYDQYVTLT